MCLLFSVFSFSFVGMGAEIMGADMEAHHILWLSQFIFFSVFMWRPAHKHLGTFFPPQIHDSVQPLLSAFYFADTTTTANTQALGISRMILLGHSLGGFVAGAYASKYPHRLAGMCVPARYFFQIFSTVHRYFPETIFWRMVSDIFGQSRLFTDLL